MSRKKFGQHKFQCMKRNKSLHDNFGIIFIKLVAQVTNSMNAIFSENSIEIMGLLFKEITNSIISVLYNSDLSISMKPFVAYKLNQVNFAMFLIIVYVIMKQLLFLINCIKIISKIMTEKFYLN